MSYVLFGGQEGSTNIYGVWRTDGTALGTFELNAVSAIPNANTTSSGLRPTVFAVLHSYSPTTGAVTATKVVFKGIDSSQHYNMWITGGVANSTQLVSGIPDANPNGLVPTFQTVQSIGDKDVAVFNGINTAGFHGLWVTDGTAAGTQQIAPIFGAYPNAAGPGDVNEGRGIIPNYAATFDVHHEAYVLFAGFDNSFHTGLWISDGTANGTHQIDAADANQNGVHPIGITQFGELAYFNGSNSNGDQGLWVTDGHAAHEITGIANIWQPQGGGGGIGPYYLTEYSGNLYFNGTDANGRYGLWVTDGSAGNTHVVTVGSYSLGINPAGLTAFQNQLYFNGQDASGSHHLFKYNAGTNAVTQIDLFNFDFDPNQFVTFNGKLLFNARDAASGANHSLWTYDGTTLAKFTTGTNGVNIVNVDPTGLIVVNEGEADLELSAGSAQPSAVSAGGHVTLSYSIDNLGDTTAGSPVVRVYLSTDAVLDGADTQLAQVTYGNLTSGSGIDDQNDITLPGSLSAGTYYLIVVADPGGQILEFDESNNTVVVPINVGSQPQQYNGHTYAFVSFNSTPQSWTEARMEAAAMGGYLATISSQGENDFILNSVLNGHLPQAGSAAFIGASDAVTEGVWKWVAGPQSGTTFWNGAANGSPAGGQYANWASGEPNNFGGGENYAVIGQNGKWVDVPSLRGAGATVGFVVEFSPTRRAIASDFNGDAVSDILFRNNTTGDTGFYQLNSNGTLQGWHGIGGSSTAYAAVGTGDFNADGVSDILWRNNTNGDTGFYQLNSNGTLQGWHGIGPSSAAYTVAGVGDFNADGVSDILFRSNATGDTGFYQMNSNGTLQGWHGIGASSTSYAVAGTGDFNGDGVSDILFRNNTTGDTGFYQMNSNGTLQGWHSIGASSAAYGVAGVGDFNGDGVSDILFRNNATGDTGFYQMNSGGTLQGWHSIGASSTAYSIARVGDYNGDGASDILFRNGATGDTGFYQMNSNGTLQGWHSIGASSTAYNVVG